MSQGFEITGNSANKTLNNNGYNNRQLSPLNFGIKTASGQLNGQPDNDCVDLHAKSGLIKDSISGTFQGSDININVKQLLDAKTISGNIKGKDFELKEVGSFTKKNGFSGHIGEKQIDLKFTSVSASYNSDLTGKIGDKNVDLTIKDLDEGKRIVGNFEGENIDLLIKSVSKGKSIQGFCGDKKINLKTKNSDPLGSTFDVKGTFGGHPDFLPVLFSTLYNMQYEETADTAFNMMIMKNMNK